MGYRSDVAIAVEKEFWETQLNGLDEASKNLVKELINEAEVKEREGWLLFLWEDYKWYDEFFAISWVNRIADENVENVSFIRIGDNKEDIEDSGEGNDPFFLGYTRQIKFI